MGSSKLSTVSPQGLVIRNLSVNDAKPQQRKALLNESTTSCCSVVNDNSNQVILQEESGRLVTFEINEQAMHLP